MSANAHVYRAVARALWSFGAPMGGWVEAA